MRAVLIATSALFLFGCASKDAVGAVVQPQDLALDAMTARSILGDDYADFIRDNRSSRSNRPVRVRSIEAHLSQMGDDEATSRRRAALINASISASDLYCARYFERISRTDSLASSALGTFSIISASVATAARASQNAWAAGAVGFTSTRDLVRSEWLSDQSTSLIFRTVILERQRISTKIGETKNFQDQMAHVYRYHAACSVEAALTVIEAAVEREARDSGRLENISLQVQQLTSQIGKQQQPQDEPEEP